MQPRTGFHVASVHSIFDLSLIGFLDEKDHTTARRIGFESTAVPEEVMEPTQGQPHANARTVIEIRRPVSRVEEVTSWVNVRFVSQGRMKTLPLPVRKSVGIAPA